MRRIIIILLILAAILAPFELLGLLRKSANEAQDIAASPEARSLIQRFREELPNLGDKVTNLLKKLLPQLNLGVQEVR